MAVEVRWAREAEGALTPQEAAETRLRVMMVDQQREAALAAVGEGWDA